MDLMSIIRTFVNNLFPYDAIIIGIALVNYLLCYKNTVKHIKRVEDIRDSRRTDRSIAKKVKS